MNQILLTDNYNNRDKRNDNNKNYNKNNSKDIKKIIIFFAVVILVFGAAIGILYGYNLYKNSKGQSKEVKRPELSLEKTEDEVTIIAKAEAGIDKIIYQWNDEDENVEEYGGRTKQEEKINIPDGDNTLKVKVIDQAGQEIETTEEFFGTGSGEENNDKIEINVTTIDRENDVSLIKISVDSEEPIKYIKYKRNEEEEKTIEPTEEKTHIEETIEARKGKNNISVFVEDIDGNTKQYEKSHFVKLRPKFEVYTEGNRLYMIITHDKGFKKIDFNINGVELTYDETIEDYDPEKETIEYYFELQNGENYVKITAESNEYTEFANSIDTKAKEGTTATYEGRCNLE